MSQAKLNNIHLYIQITAHVSSKHCSRVLNTEYSTYQYKSDHIRGLASDCYEHSTAHYSTSISALVMYYDTYPVSLSSSSLRWYIRGDVERSSWRHLSCWRWHLTGSRRHVLTCRPCWGYRWQWWWISTINMKL